MIKTNIDFFLNPFYKNLIILVPIAKIYFQLLIVPAVWLQFSTSMYSVYYISYISYYSICVNVIHFFVKIN